MIRTTVSKSGTVDMKTTLYEVEDGSISINNDSNCVNEDDNIIDTVDDTKPSSPNTIFELDYILEPREAIRIESLEEFNDNKVNILKCNYVSIYRKDYAFSIVGDNGSYFLIDTRIVPITEISKLLVFRKPKKLIFDINQFDFLSVEGSSGIIDIKLAFKFLYNLDCKKIIDIFFYIKAPQAASKNVYLLCSNLINIAKFINIDVEKNKLNKYFYQEMDIALLTSTIGNRGIPINKDLFNLYVNNIKEEYKLLSSKKDEIYGKEFDFSQSQMVLKAIKNDFKTLNSELLSQEINHETLVSDYLLYKKFQQLPFLNLNNNRLIVNYDTYNNYGIKQSVGIDNSILDFDNYTFIEGKYVDLYYKVFAELTKIKDIIDVSSNDVLLEYINEFMYGEKNEYCKYTGLFIKVYANKIFEPMEIQKLLIEKYQTLINVGDISAINEMFNDKFKELMLFFKGFNGNDVIYERLNKKLFYPETSLNNFIYQVMNRIMKEAIVLTGSGVYDYNKKYNNSISIVGLSEDNIILMTTNEKATNAALDILNRTMGNGYKRFIKNTIYRIETTPIEYKS